jgi:hypothetical protein
MEIKEFKEGIAFLAKLTNQRKTDPEPFLLQVGLDGLVSLIAGDERGNFVWRTGIKSSNGRMKEGVPSKPLVQMAKTLKGKFDVSFEVSDRKLMITTSEGGSISVPFVESPTLAPIRLTNELGRFKIDDVAGLGAEIAAVTDPSIGWDYVELRCGHLIATNERKYLDAMLPDYWELGPHAHRATFWNALSAAKTDGEAFVFESGMRVVAGKYEGSTGFVAPRKVPDMVAATYEEGAPHENVAVMDRKVLIGSLKAVGPNVEITLFREKMVNLTGAEGRQVGMTAKHGRGSSSIRFSADLMTDILSAMAGKEVIVAWKDDARKPLMIRDSGKQGHVFLLAPVSKIA